MALVKDPVGRAHKASTPLQARRLRDELEIELALNSDVPAGWESEADRAVDVLNERFGEDALDKVDPEGTGTRGWTPTPSPGAQRGSGARPGDLGRHGARTRRGGPPRSPTAPKAPAARQPQRGPQPRRGGGGRGLKMPGLPPVAGVDTARSFATQLLGLGLGLSLAYLLLRDAEHPKRWGSAVQGAISALTTGVRALTGPVDPLRPNTAKTTTLNVAATKRTNAAAIKASDLVIPGLTPVTRPRSGTTLNVAATKRTNAAAIKASNLIIPGLTPTNP